MRFALMIEAQQGLSYADQLAIARRAEAAGFEAMVRSDHYESFPGPAGRPTTDAWAVLAGLARETSRLPGCPRLAGDVRTWATWSRS
jgi:alkanesulfonate monooxygenase SsuD/methylene tetrahydromethanopterin reductase-like flavin-dependent oxidoreductase (luciferase family)